MKFFATLLACILPVLAPACELCSISSADSARREAARGFVLTLSEQYVPFATLQVNGEPYPKSATFFQQAFYERFITHIVPTYNFSRSFGLSLNIPYVHGDFRRTEVTPLGKLIDEQGTVSDLGDVALIGRWTAFQKHEMDYDMVLNILGGIKFPTGETERLEDERRQELRYLQLPGVHKHSIGGIHQHDLSPGSGSFDGVMGVSANLRWKRLFFFSQFQYYLRTEALDYEMGDLTIVSGGPGVYLLRNKDATLSLLANAFYENQLPDQALGQVNNQTGFSAWFIGPELAFAWGNHFSMNAGVDVPLAIYNRGIQSVPDYRVHGGFNWKF